MPNKEYYWKNKEKIIKQNKQYRKKNKRKISGYYKKWYKKNGRNRAIDYTDAINEWIKNNPEKVKAKSILNSALISGTIIKPKRCCKCNNITRLSAHHKNYNKPLDVLWLCSSCHKTLHNKLKLSLDK